MDQAEHLGPRSLCPLDHDRALLVGKRMLLLERDSLDPRLTADVPMRCFCFCLRRLEVVTPLRRSVRVWGAPEGRLLRIYEDVVSSSVSAMRLDWMERRLVVG